MKRAALLAMVALAAGFAIGCERNDATSKYDPKIDGVNPPTPKPVDLSILDDQKALLAKAGGGISTPTPVPVSTAPATTTSADTTTAPASDTQPASSPPPPPPSDASPPPPPPPG